MEFFSLLHCSILKTCLHSLSMWFHILSYFYYAKKLCVLNAMCLSTNASSSASYPSSIVLHNFCKWLSMSAFTKMITQTIITKFMWTILINSIFHVLYSLLGFNANYLSSNCTLIKNANFCTTITNMQALTAFRRL